MKKLILLLLILTFFINNIFSTETNDISNNNEILLKEFQSGKIKQTYGEVYSYYVPRNKVTIRENKSLNSSKIGQLDTHNYLDYDIVDEFKDWLTIYLKDKIIGYSKKYIKLDNGDKKYLFDECDYIKINNNITINDFQVQFDYIKVKNGIIHKNGKSHNMRGKYYYEVYDDNDTLLSKGNAQTVFKNFINNNNNNRFKKEVVDIYTLNLNNKHIGWMVATLKEGYDKYYGIDFSSTTVIVPRIINNIFDLYSEYLGGIKFNLTDYFNINENELYFTKMSTAYGMMSWGYSQGQYYKPKIVKIIYENDKILIQENLDMEITDNFIHSNPTYAYALSYIINDKNSMRKSYNEFKNKLEIVSSKCNKYYKDLNEFIETEFRESIYEYDDNGNLNEELLSPKNVIHLKKYWKSFDIDNLDEVVDYLDECTENSIGFYHLLYRTGLYPDPRLIEYYLNSPYEGYPRD
ncbi:MAG: hypothetical protein H8E55_66925 [Pelagibacterales bacterium]|nr:hypothetical protein [Pelagibacterales bacterium]